MNVFWDSSKLRILNRESRGKATPHSTALPESSRLQFTPGLNIGPILNCLRQVAVGHGRINTKAAFQEMSDYHGTGFTTWDLADDYGPSEDFIG